VVRGFEVGGIDYVTKPIRPQEVMARIGSHIRTARMMSQTRGVLEQAAHAVIVLGGNGLPLWQTSKASLWLERYFPASAGAPSGHKLPPRLQSWLNDSLARQRQGGLGGVAEIAPLVVRDEQGELSIAIAPGGQGHGITLLLEEKRIAAGAPPMAPATEDAAAAPGENFRLTPRENDVLMWLGKGKTNRDIADILGMSPRTVNKHLEHIFVKLGVETRSAAAVMASAMAQPAGGLLQ
jgi:DNA-binding CsgD family transcriptional regulator